MTDKHPERPEPASEIILYQTKDGRNRVEVRLEHEMVRLEAMEQLPLLIFSIIFPTKNLKNY